MTSFNEGLMPVNRYHPLQIDSSEAVKKLGKNLQPHENIKLKFVNSSRTELERSAQNLETGSKGMMRSAGFLAGAALLLKIGVLLGVGLGAAAVAVTPIGWAALGLCAISFAFLAIRHGLKENAGVSSDLSTQLKKRTMDAVKGALVGITSPLLAIGKLINMAVKRQTPRAMLYGLVNDKSHKEDFYFPGADLNKLQFFKGFSQSANNNKWGHLKLPLIITTGKIGYSGEHMKGLTSEKIGERKNTIFLFKGDTYHVNEQGEIIIEPGS